MAIIPNILLYLSICFISVYSYEYVPVYMFETSKNYSPLPALGRINEEFFRDILLDKLSKDKVILVFLEENLSPEDFTTFDSTGNNVFNSLSNIQNYAQVNYYPFVEAPLKAIESLPGIKASKVYVTENGLPDGTKFEPGQVLIIDMNDANENEGRSQMLSRHDSLMASIYKSAVSENNNVIALYTARHTSWLVPSEIDENGNGRKARHLMAAAATDEEENLLKSMIITSNFTSTLMYLSDSMVLTIASGGNERKFIYYECKEEDSDKDADVLNLSCQGNSSKPLKFLFTEDRGYWFLNRVNFTVDDAKDISIIVREVYAPYQFSYHCNDAKFAYVYEDEENKKDPITYSLILPGFQVERFLNNTTIKKFDDAYDCIGFTTAPIWSGLFVTFILALIMTFGLCMIMDIKTMDRFDDPKGKTISINVSE